MSTTQIVVTIVVIVLVVAAVAFAWSAMRRRALRERFGPEYDRVVAETENPRAAERELRERERRHAELTLVELSPESRQKYAAAWEELQAQFVDDPARAVGQADELVTRLVAERGYPTENYDDQLAHLSVDHARTLGHYRDAHDIHLRNERGEASTEQLRQAVVHYRALVADLLGDTSLAARSEAAAGTAGAAATATTTDADRDGVPDRFETDRADARVDADRDAVPDRFETDRADARVDADRDGVPDRFETDSTAGSGLSDRVDADRDGVPDRVEADDADRAGKPGLMDRITGRADTDHDGVPDRLENDRTPRTDDSVPDSRTR